MELKIFLLPSDIIAHTSKEFAKDEEVAGIEAVLYMASNFNLSVDANSVDVLLQVVAEELINEELLGLK